MAPANGSSKSRKGSAAKQGNGGAQGSSGAAAQPKPATGAATPKAVVVPALPLPYGKKRPSGDATAALEDANVAEQDKKTNAKKGGADKPKKQANDKNSAAPDAAKQPSEPKKNENDKKDSAQSEKVTAAAKKDEQTGTSALIVGGNLPAAAQTPKSGAEKKAEAPKANNTSTKSNPRSSMSPTGYQMPPPFHPANRPPHFHAGNGPEPTHNTHRHGHQPHPSNGSIHFGAFPGSQTSSSPAPPLSAGGMPAPPGMGMPDGHQPQHFMGHANNGFPPAMHYGGPDMMPMPAFDNYGRPSVGFPPMDSYNPYGRGYGPSGPHSFHGSQSSNAEELGMYNHFHHGPPPGSNGNGDDSRVANGNGNPYGFSRVVPNDQSTQQGDEPNNADDLAQYIAQQFGNTTLSDCTLELRYLDDRSAPVRIPGHRIIFNRNPRLAELIRQQTLPPSPSGNTAQTLLLETESKWIRSDSFYTAVQYLYGLPLLPRPGAKGSGEPAEFSDAGSHTDKLDFALAYAAAGHLLDSTPVLTRGCQVAASLINWQTIERILEFALEDFRDHGLHDAYKYGVGSKALLDAVVTFIVQNFPSTFDLDVFVADPVQFARLPVRLTAAARPPVAEAQPKQPEAHESTPSVQFGKGRRSQKVTGIQFGDLAVPEVKPSESETPKASRQAQPVSHAVLSRILLNIPFTQLKMIMESSGSGNVHGWANAESRYKIVKSAVEERESLRHRALQAVLDGSVANSEVVISKLRSPEPRESDEWSVLGWMEEMLPYGNMDGPSLGRKWVPISLPPSAVGYPVAEYP